MQYRRNAPRVLLVDDDPAVRAVLRQCLSDLGVQPVEADNPFSALGRLADGPFHLAITDLAMPERSGVWLVEELHSRIPDLPVIVLAAGEPQTHALRALFGPALRVLAKPFERVQLEALVRELVPEAGPAVPAGAVATETPSANGAPAALYRYASTLVGEMIANTVGLDPSGIAWRSRIHPDDHPRLDQEAQAALRAGRRFRAEYRMRTTTGDQVWLLHEAPVSADAAGLPVFGPGALIDITAHKREEEGLRASEERHRFLTEQSADMITVQSADARCLYVSPACFPLLGYTPAELRGTTFFDLVHRDDRNRVRASYDQALERPQLVTVDFRIRRSDWRYTWFESTSRVIARSDPALPREIISVSRDITARKLTEQRLRELAILDDLTGLYNRRGFITLAQQQLKSAHRARRAALLLFADLNNLKQINDTLGHRDGDQALIDAAHVFHRTFRESDVIARVGGDEFAILAMESEPAHLETIRSRLEAALRLANSDRARAFTLSISLGAAAYDPGRNDSIEELLAWADRAMYEHKRACQPRLN